MQNNKTAFRIRLVPWIVFLFGLALTSWFQHAARESAKQAVRSEFDFRVNEIIQNIDRRLHSYEQVLEGVAGLFQASDFVERREFAEYVQSLRLEGKYPGIQGVGFAQLVPPRDKARHLAQIRRDGFPDYDIRPAGLRDPYTSIIYLEPFNWRNQRAFGYDMYAEPTRRAAMERARDEDTTAISGKVQLVQETEQNVQPGFLMYLPIFVPKASHRTLEERRANLMGWVYAPFRMNDLMAGILGQHFGEISASMDLEIYDGDATDAKQLMFDSNGRIGKMDTAFHAVRPITLLGHSWTVVVHSLPSFDAQLRSEKADIIIFAGVVGSGLMAMVAWLIMTGQARAQSLAEQMTVELRQQEAEQEKLNRALRLLSACNTTLIHAEDEYKLLAEICRLCVERGGYLMAWVGYADQDDARTVRPITQSGYEHGYLDHIDITWADTERGQGPTGTAIRTGMTNVNQNVLTNPKMAPWREAAIQRGYQSSIALPLIGEARVLGALTMYAREPDAFTHDEVRLLEELANDLAFGIVTLRTRAAHAQEKEKASFLAHFDPLTHLPNRLLLRDRFEHAAQVAESLRARVAMLYLDMDEFNQINDSLGHDLGDKVLVMAAERLQRCIAATDTISRLSGDEFVILLTGNADAQGIANVANAIRDAFSDPLKVEGHVLNISFSIGISVFPADGGDFDTLLKGADTALHRAKESGRNTYRFFTQEMNAGLLEQIRLTGGLLNGLRQGEFVLHYQPQVDIRSGRVTGAEALIRWRHPVDGLVSPAKFIPLAEQSGHIVQIGEWVLNEACRQAKAWLDQGFPLVMAVNLSAVQFKRGDIIELVSRALAASNLPPRHLELELTESILLQDIETTMQTLRGLKSMGLKLSIDDFGTGYSSLSYLKQLAVDKLKIDQSFIRDMLTDADGASIVRAVIQLGHALQLDVIAEGVETEPQLAFLRDYGCDEVQGYLFSRPVPADHFVPLLAKTLPMLPWAKG
ncbi:MAG: EAL domain-containing protein [Rhodocyclaceae bacterium]|nr:MAG: EAL domain-containing protein [Rhodocyclaceae bacterium]